MSVYKGLWKKEMAMMRGFHVLISLALLGIMIYTAFQTKHMEWMIGMATISIIIVPATLLFSLNMEKHQFAMFLFTRKQLANQVFVKFLHGFLLFILYFVLMGICVTILHFFGWMPNTLSHTWEVLLVLFLFIFLISLLLALSVYMAWVVHQWMKEKIGTIISIISLFILFNVFITGFGWIENKLSFLENWWTLDVSFLVDIPFTIFITDGRLSLSMMLVIYLIYYVCYRIFTWILIKKVEA